MLPPLSDDTLEALMVVIARATDRDGRPVALPFGSVFAHEVLRQMPEGVLEPGGYLFICGAFPDSES